MAPLRWGGGREIVGRCFPAPHLGDVRGLALCVAQLDVARAEAVQGVDQQRLGVGERWGGELEEVRKGERSLWAKQRRHAAAWHDTWRGPVMPDCAQAEDRQEDIMTASHLRRADDEGLVAVQRQHHHVQQQREVALKVLVVLVGHLGTRRWVWGQVLTSWCRGRDRLCVIWGSPGNAAMRPAARRTSVSRHSASSGRVTSARMAGDM